MMLKLQLVRDGEILFEMPLSPTDWPAETLETELEDFTEESRTFSKIFDALSNRTRLRMMTRLMERRNRAMHFSNFMRDLHLNPKIVWENARKLREGGLLEKTGRGMYRCSELGETGFMMVSRALRRLMNALEEFVE